MRSEDEIRADAADERPFSNGTEWDMWADRWCHECVNDDNPMAGPEVFCPIITVALLGKTGERAAWPKEWTRQYIKFGDYVDEERTRRQPIETTADDPDACEYVGECTEFQQHPDPGDGPDPESGPPPACDGQLDLIDWAIDESVDRLVASVEMAPRTVSA